MIFNFAKSQIISLLCKECFNLVWGFFVCGVFLFVFAFAFANT